MINPNLQYTLFGKTFIRKIFSKIRLDWCFHRKERLPHSYQSVYPLFMLKIYWEMSDLKPDSKIHLFESEFIWYIFTMRGTTDVPCKISLMILKKFLLLNIVFNTLSKFHSYVMDLQNLGAQRSRGLPIEWKCL